MELPTDTLAAVYPSPLGEIILASSNGILRGLWFSDQKYACAGLTSYRSVPLSDEAFCDVSAWLDDYFEGSRIPPLFPFEPLGTAFQKRVWAELMSIPYGQTSSYGAIASTLGCKSARAVGSAIGKNPISVVIPCHRVVGSSGKLTGYAGGLDRKKKLLALEMAYISE